MKRHESTLQMSVASLSSGQLVATPVFLNLQLVSCLLPVLGVRASLFWRRLRFTKETTTMLRHLLCACRSGRALQRRRSRRTSCSSGNFPDADPVQIAWPLVAAGSLCRAAHLSELPAIALRFTSQGTARPASSSSSAASCPGRTCSVHCLFSYLQRGAGTGC